MTETPAAPKPAIGQTLRNRRLQKSLTAEQVAQETRIHIKFIRALEEERWKDFPARVYLEGFLRRYAALLGLEESVLIQQLHQIFQQEEKPKFSGPAPNYSSDETTLPPAAARSLWLLLGGGALVLALALAYVKLEERRSSMEHSAAAETMATSPVPPTTPPPVSASHNVEVSAKAPVWARVWVDGRVKFEGVLPARQPKTWTVLQTLRVMAGNPALVEVKMDGTVLGPRPGGAAGEVLWNVNDQKSLSLIPSSGTVTVVPPSAAEPSAPVLKQTVPHLRKPSSSEGSIPRTRPTTPPPPPKTE